MAFGDVLLANEHLYKVLAEAEVPNLEGQVDFDLNDRRGWGSFGDVYMGQYNGIVSSTTHLSAAQTELMPKFTSTERLRQDLERNSLHPRSSMGKVPSGTHLSSPTLDSSNEGPILDIQRLKREIRVWREVLHPNVVALLGWTLQVVRYKIRVSLISTWCNGGNIKEYLCQNLMADRHALVRFVSISVASQTCVYVFTRSKMFVEDWPTFIPEV